MLPKPQTGRGSIALDGDAGVAPPRNGDGFVGSSYDQLCRMAASYLRREAADPLWSAAVLVHEAYLRIARRRRPWHDRSHFVAATARVMRRILIERGRARGRRKHGGEWRRIAIEEVWAAAALERPGAAERVAVRRALAELGATAPRSGRVVALRVFEGLSWADAAGALGVSAATAKRDWRMAKRFLLARLIDDRPRRTAATGSFDGPG